MKLTKILIVCLALMALCLTGCNGTENNVEEPTANPNAGIEKVSMILTADDFAKLDEYPDLKELDASGSTCYEDILRYADSHPGIKVTYTVPLGSQALSNASAEATLEASDSNFEELMENLKYLPNITRISLPSTNLDREQLASLSERYSNIALDYTVQILDETYGPAVVELNLSAMTSEQVTDVAKKLPLLPSVTNVELMTEDGTCALTKADVKALQDSMPGTLFNYSFDLFGKTVSTTDESISYYDLKLTNESEAEVREALDILTSCTYFKLDDCGIDSTVMASIRDDYPDVKVVWRIYCDRFTMCTDETMVRMTFGLDDTNNHELKYCTDVTYMDLGHNDDLTDVSFVQYMPNLECVILSGSPVSDISAFADHDKLLWMELAFCSKLQDISSMTSCDNLKYLNVSYTKVSDISGLEKLPLDRFNAMNTKISRDDQKLFEQWHPDCISRWEGKQPYGYGWRYDDYGYTFFEYYANMRVIFRYADKQYTGNRKER